jgi:hypothetical protein
MNTPFGRGLVGECDFLDFELVAPMARKVVALQNNLIASFGISVQIVRRRPRS